MSSLPDAIKQLVRERANNRCEYCLSHQQYIMGRLQIDHVIPSSKNGTDDEDNLCLACELCNQHKWTKTEGFDLDLGKQVPLYNPRIDRWESHFEWTDDGEELTGLTACGRATIEALNMNSQLAKIVRRNWIMAGWHPPTE